MIKVAILGYGNIGKYAEEAVMSAPDMALAGIYHHRDDLEAIDADVVLLCTPTRAVEQFASFFAQRGICTVDSFDIHNQIYALRQSRTDLITGQADQMPPDGQAMQLVLDNIAAQEAALTAMFMGTVQHSTDVKTFTIVPDTLGGENIVARLSALNGIVDSEDLSGAPIYVNIEVAERGKLPVNEVTGLVKDFALDIK